jgi:phage tail sheath protein FI
VRPDTIICPGFPEATVHTAQIGCAAAIRASTVLDGTNTDDATVIALAGATSDAEGRANLVDPWGVDGSDTIPGSFYAAAAYASTPWWESPSNFTLTGITGTSRPIFHELTNDADQAQALNSAKITTIVQRDGFRLWGNRNLSPDGYDLPFVVQRRSDDVVKRALATAVASRVDTAITPALADLLVRSLQAFFDREQALGHIAGGLSALNPDLNTEASLGAGNIFIDYEITFNVPAENITFRSIFTNRFLENVTG